MRSWFELTSLSLRLLYRERSDTALRILVLALLVSVASMTSVGFFTDRIRAALEQQANHLLAADLVLQSDHPLAQVFFTEAARRGLAFAQTVQFPSMAQSGEQSALAQIKAVAPGYPLRGELKITAAGQTRSVRSIPAPGTVWVEQNLLAQLKVEDNSIVLGNRRFRIAAILSYEPDRPGELFNIAPRLMLNIEDLAATGLLGSGSRARYALLVAGAKPAVEQYGNWVKPRLSRGEKILSVRDARPEVRAALDQANRFLTLAAFISVVLGAATVALGARLYVQRQLDACALMRCFGLSGNALLGLYSTQFLALGLLASLAGTLLGFAAHFVLAQQLGSLLAQHLPAPGWMPVLTGMSVGMLTLFAAALPPLVQLKRVPALRVLRRDLGGITRGNFVTAVLIVSTLSALLYWQAADQKLAAIALGGIAAVMIVSWSLAVVLLRTLASLKRGVAFGWAYAWVSLGRRVAPSAVQVSAFTVGFLALLLLSVVRGDLLERWQSKIPPHAPNRFLINVQPDQVAAITALLRSQGIGRTELFPMIRARLVAINGVPLDPSKFANPRSRRLAEREFNLSWTQVLPSHNRLVSGRWAPQLPSWSVERGIAEALGIRLGDRLAYDVAGTRVEAPVDSIREVDWDSFEVNFFVLATPGLLEPFPASAITSFYLGPSQQLVVNNLVARFPNVTVIDVTYIMNEVRRIVDRVVAATEFIFYFTLAMGLVVLYAAFAASYREREHELALMRTLGARRAQLIAIQVGEFATIGLVAGMLAGFGANGVAYVLSRELFELPFRINWAMTLLTPLAAALVLGLLGAWAAARLVQRAPLPVLRAAA